MKTQELKYISNAMKREYLLRWKSDIDSSTNSNNIDSENYCKTKIEEVIKNLDDSLEREQQILDTHKELAMMLKSYAKVKLCCEIV